MIVIKSFTKLPDNCADCSLNYDFCSCSADYNISFDINDDLGSGRRENCPLVEVEAQPEPLTLPNIYIAKDFDTVKDENGNVGFGVYIPDEKQIYVAESVPHEIFAKALFHELFHWMQDVTGRPFDEDEANTFAERIYEALPSAQPEIVRCKDCEWSDKKGCALYCCAWNRYTAWNGWCYKRRERREDGVDS